MKFNTKLCLIAAGTAAFAAIPSAAMAEGVYIGFGAGVSLPGDSENLGEFNATVPATPDFGTIPAGTPLGWNTGFDTGLALSGQLGYKFDNGFRLEVEGNFSQNDVTGHNGFQVGGANIDGADVAVLTRGAPAAGNPTVGAFGATDTGRVNTYGLFANVFYDINTGTAIKPYVGAGAGVQWVDVRYQPSDVRISDDTASGFAYQLMAGATYELSSRAELFGQYAYRANTERADIGLDLLPATLGVESNQSVLTAGLRLKFGN